MKNNIVSQFIFFFAVIFSAFFLAAFSVNSAENQQVKNELQQLKQQIQQIEKNLKTKLDQQNKATKQLRSAEKKIATASKILKTTNRQLNEKNQHLSELNRQQKNLQSNKAAQKKALAQQIKAAYINGQQEYLKMLLNQQNPETLGRMLVYYDYMNKARIAKVDNLQKTLKELETIEKTISQEINQLNILKKSKQAETEKLLKLKQKRQQVVNQLNKAVDTDSKKLKELQTNQKELQKLINTVQDTLDKIDFSQPLDGIKHLRGKLKWPASGKHIQKFGIQLAAGLKSKGVVIKANEGDSVKSVHYGRVVYADWLRGFGLLLILDHGKGYMSLYGYNQALYKQVGDWVESGETIATVGQSGGRNESALYFELRHQGKPFSPNNWLGR